MLVNITMKRLIDFHGHLCPDLIIGAKFSEYVQKFLSSREDKKISIIAENSTSAIDAIQVLLGTTVGNHRLHIFDFGKHNYTVFLTGSREAFRFSLKEISFGDEEEFNQLGEKIIDEEIVFDEIIRLQKLLDERVRLLLELKPNQLFEIEELDEWIPLLKEMPSVYITCEECKQPVLKRYKVDYKGKSYCIPCFQKVSSKHVSSIQQIWRDFHG